MKNNYDYIKEFINKHHYKPKVNVQCYKNTNIDSIKHVIFDEHDIPSGQKISIDDIVYDIETNLPEDVFYRYLEYCNSNKNENVSYVYWMTKMDNRYIPMGIDNSESEKMKKLIYDKINEMRNMKWF